MQTPLTGYPAAMLRIGDLVWFRHAKSGELFEHTNTVRLLAGDAFVDEVPTYRGLRERLVSNAAEVLDAGAGRGQPTLGTGRLICVDGPAGSGKTTLAEEVASLSGAPVIHMDDLFEGWDGLPRVTDQLDTLLPPLADGLAGQLPALGLAGHTPGPRPSSYRRRRSWCSRASGRARSRTPHLITVLAWVEVPYDLRMARGLERGGVGVAENWRQWAVDEQERLRPRAHPRARRRRPRRAGRLAPAA